MALRSTTRPLPAVLAVDPGETTGWCLFRLRGGVGWELRLHGMSANGVPPLAWDGLRAVVVEELPTDRGTPKQLMAYNQAVNLALSLDLQLHRVRPASWKPWAAAKGVRAEALDPELPHKRTRLKKHALDAYCLGRYALWLHHGGS